MVRVLYFFGGYSFFRCVTTTTPRFAMNDHHDLINRLGNLLQHGYPHEEVETKLMSYCISSQISEVLLTII